MEKIGFFEAIRLGFANYARFRGRARVPEFWWWVLFYWLTVLVVIVVESALTGNFHLTTGICGHASSRRFCTGYQFNGGPVTSVVMLILLIPSLAVFSRRLHDTDRRFWWMLLGLIPVVGPIILIVWTATPGTPGPNRFGPDPAGPRR